MQKLAGSKETELSGNFQQEFATNIITFTKTLRTQTLQHFRVSAFEAKHWDIAVFSFFFAKKNLWHLIAINVSNNNHSIVEVLLVFSVVMSFQWWFVTAHFQTSFAPRVRPFFCNNFFFWIASLLSSSGGTVVDTKIVAL